MAKTFDYRKRADECSLRAATASNDQAREVWREMESYWRKRLEATGSRPSRSRAVAKAEAG
jgi:hypothetical protein